MFYSKKKKFYVKSVIESEKIKMKKFKLKFHSNANRKKQNVLIKYRKHSCK